MELSLHIETNRIGNTPSNLILVCFIDNDKIVLSQPKMAKPSDREVVQILPTNLRSESGGIRIIQNNAGSFVNASQINQSMFSI